MRKSSARFADDDLRPACTVFPSSPNYGTAYVLDRKAREYLTFNPSDREGVRKLYKEAIEAGLQSGYAALPDVALVYFSNLCDDYKMGEVYPDAVWMSTLVWPRFRE